MMPNVRQLVALVLLTITLIKSIAAFIPLKQHQYDTISFFEYTRIYNSNIYCKARKRNYLRSKTILFANNENEKELNNQSVNIKGGKRREVVSTWMRKAFLIGLGYKTTTTSSVSNAVDDNTAAATAVNGRIVTFQIQNLNGVDGQTGTIKIRLAPTWAPRGVARFEVRMLCFHNVL
jgi:uncharacterized protein YqgQ